MKKINILGTNYQIETDVEPKKDKKLENRYGYTDYSIKKIVVAKSDKTDESVEDIKFCDKEVLRHEIIHAFLYESGLDSQTTWALNEEIVDWIALQLPKIKKVCEELEVI